MRHLIFFLAFAAGAAPTRSVNTFVFSPAEGTAELEWVSPSTLHLVRSWNPRQGPRKIAAIKAVAVSVTEEDSRHALTSKYLAVRTDDNFERVEIRRANGAPMTELRIRREGARMLIQQPAKLLEHFYGLGARTGALDARGTALTTRDPFLVSSAGYGEFFSLPGEYGFDLAAAEPHTISVAIPGDRVELFFYYGPSVKEIMEEHMGATGPVDRFDALELEIRDPKNIPAVEPSWKSLAGDIHALLNASLSSKLIPAFHLAPYAAGDPALLARAAQVASLAPVLYGPGNELLKKRRLQLAPYLLSYTREAQDRGFPVIRPLVTDYSEDAAALGRAEEFLLGDELLVAPVLNPAGEVKVYFPKGIWTDFETDAIFKGRQELVLRVNPGALPMFARNGTIVPMTDARGEGVLELHYFPSLGAEFFLAEQTDPEVTQFHAAPAGDLIRLESESRADRICEWVLHHAEPCQSVESGGKEFARVDDVAKLAPGTWHYDQATSKLRIRLRTAAGGDEIVHVRK